MSNRKENICTVHGKPELVWHAKVQNNDSFGDSEMACRVNMAVCSSAIFFLISIFIPLRSSGKIFTVHNYEPFNYHFGNPSNSRGNASRRRCVFIEEPFVVRRWLTLQSTGFHPLRSVIAQLSARQPQLLALLGQRHARRVVEWKWVHAKKKSWNVLNRDWILSVCRRRKRTADFDEAFSSGDRGRNFTPTEKRIRLSELAPLLLCIL